MGRLELIGRVPNPSNGSKWKIKVGGKEIMVGKEAVPRVFPNHDGSITNFLKESEKFVQKYGDIFEDEAEYHSRQRHRLPLAEN